VFVTLIILTPVIFLNKSYGQRNTTNIDKQLTGARDPKLRQGIDIPVSGLIKGCSMWVFSINVSSGTLSVFCGTFLNAIDESCKSEYYRFCFGDEWEQYKLELDNRIYNGSARNNSNRECDASFCIGDPVIYGGKYCIVVTLKGDSKCGWVS
jgi:hypothetical protein